MKYTSKPPIPRVYFMWIFSFICGYVACTFDKSHSFAFLEKIKASGFIAEVAAAIFFLYLATGLLKEIRERAGQSIERYDHQIRDAVETATTGMDQSVAAVKNACVELKMAIEQSKAVDLDNKLAELTRTVAPIRESLTHIQRFITNSAANSQKNNRWGQDKDKQGNRGNQKADTHIQKTKGPDAGQPEHKSSSQDQREKNETQPSTPDTSNRGTTKATNTPPGELQNLDKQRNKEDAKQPIDQQSPDSGAKNTKHPEAKPASNKGTKPQTVGEPQSMNDKKVESSSGTAAPQKGDKFTEAVRRLDASKMQPPIEKKDGEAFV